MGNCRPRLSPSSMRLAFEMLPRSVCPLSSIQMGSGASPLPSLWSEDIHGTVFLHIKLLHLQTPSVANFVALFAGK